MLEERLVVLEMERIKDEGVVFGLVRVIMMDVLLEKMGMKKKGKVVVMEEGWKGMGRGVMGE